MGKITVETCHIEGLKVITPTVFGDERGYFMETYNYNDYKAAGIDMEFVQDNQSSSRRGVLRGLHFQINVRPASMQQIFHISAFLQLFDLTQDLLFNLCFRLRPKGPDEFLYPVIDPLS